MKNQFFSGCSNKSRFVIDSGLWDGSLMAKQWFFRIFNPLIKPPALSNYRFPETLIYGYKLFAVLTPAGYNHILNNHSFPQPAIKTDFKNKQHLHPKIQVQ
ncbi:MAG: hypothetical protein U0T68_08305 [Ferruginibacter sp.]